MFGSVQIMYIPCMLPIVLKVLGKAFLREMISWTAAVFGVGVLWSCEGVMLVV